ARPARRNAERGGVAGAWVGGRSRRLVSQRLIACGGVAANRAFSPRSSGRSQQGHISQPRVAPTHVGGESFLSLLQVNLSGSDRFESRYNHEYHEAVTDVGGPPQ